MAEVMEVSDMSESPPATLPAEATTLRVLQDAPCCDPSDQAICCEPAAKPDCCGGPAAGCGCR
jgi:hypothetical protein